MRKRLIALPVIAAATLGLAGIASAMDVPAAVIAQVSPLAKIDADPMPTNVIAPLPPRRAEAQRIVARPAQARTVAYQPMRVVQAQPIRPACQTPRCGPLMMTGVTY